MKSSVLLSTAAMSLVLASACALEPSMEENDSGSLSSQEEGLKKGQINYCVSGVRMNKGKVKAIFAKRVKTKKAALKIKKTLRHGTISKSKCNSNRHMRNLKEAMATGSVRLDRRTGVEVYRQDKVIQPQNVSVLGVEYTDSHTLARIVLMQADRDARKWSSLIRGAFKSNEFCVYGKDGNDYYAGLGLSYADPRRAISTLRQPAHQQNLVSEDEFVSTTYRIGNRTIKLFKKDANKQITQDISAERGFRLIASSCQNIMKACNKMGPPVEGKVELLSDPGNYTPTGSFGNRCVFMNEVINQAVKDGELGAHGVIE